ncbi:hypothetical protein [Haliscomenobacter hydrossis]|nr:hypothetical protein [Haliscomenobacter hydrossis]
MDTKELTRWVKPPQVELEPPLLQPNPKNWIWLLLIAATGIFAAINWEDYVVEKDGKLELAPKRKAKLKKELNEIDNAVQYALIARTAGEYPCLNCGNRKTIYLNVGDVWKYGTTRLGENGRYKSDPIDDRLRFLPEFAGNYAECLKMEKIKIYNYVLLPENQKRKSPIIRPPGNPYDI